MATGFNRGIFIGNVVDAPETRPYGDGTKSLTRFKLAVNRGKSETLFVNSTAFAGLGGICARYLHKGSSVLVESRVQVERYTDKHGAKRQAAALVIDNMTMLGEGSNAGMNTGVWVGTLGADPVSVKAGTKTKVRFSIAINDPKYKSKPAVWIDVTAWEKTAEQALAVLSKGTSVAVIGRLTSRTFERKDGTKGDSVEIVMESFQRVGRKPGGGALGGPATVTRSSTSAQPAGDPDESLDSSDFIPF